MRKFDPVIAFCLVFPIPFAIAWSGEQAKTYRYRIANDSGRVLSTWPTPEGAGAAVESLLGTGHVELRITREVVDKPATERGGCKCECRCGARKASGKKHHATPLDREWEEHGDDPSYFGITGTG